MNPELLSSLAAEHRRDLTSRTMLPGRTARAVRPARGTRPPSRLKLPRYRVSWTRTTLAAVAGQGRARSVVIVISATRTL